MDVRGESQVGVLLDTQAKAFCRRLQEVAVAGRALRVELEILDTAVVQDDDLDVLPAHVDDDVRVVVELQGRFGVRHGLDQRHIGVQNVFENVLGVTGGGDAQNFQLRLLRFDLAAQVLEHFNRVLDRIAVRELISLAENVAVLIEQHGLGRGGTAVDADEAADSLVGVEGRRNEFLAPVCFFESIQFLVAGGQALGAGLGFLFLASELDVVHQLVVATVTADAVLFAFAELNGAHGGKVLRVLRNLDQILGLGAVGNLHLALLPHAGNIRLPGFAHAFDEAVRPAEQQHVRPQGMAAGQHAEVLQHDGFEERCHQFIRRRSNFLQAVDVGLGEHAALAGDLVQLDAVIALHSKLGGRNFQLGVDLVDDRAGAAGALVVHRRDFLLAPSLIVVLEDDDLGVLAAQFDDGIDLRMQLLDGERNRGDFLHELGADLVGDTSAARTGHEHAGVVAVDADFGFNAPQEFERLLRLLGLVALVVLPQDLVGVGFHHGGLDRR